MSICNKKQILVFANKNALYENKIFKYVYIITQLSKMIHNKYFEIMTQYVGDLNKKWHGRGLAKRISLSQKATALALKNLKKENLLKSEKKGNMKNYYINTKNPEIKDTIKIVEIMRKIRFLRKHKKLREIFGEDKRIVGIFGSYAKEEQTEESDLDVFIIGDQKKEDYDELGNMFDLEVRIKYFTETQFKKLLKEKNNLFKEIVQYHILIFGTENFIDTVWSNYYGFD